MTEINKGKTIYLYLDEAGNYDFRESGSTFFIMTCVVMERPFEEVQTKILKMKYDCLEQGLDLDRFHASDDRQNTRDLFFGILSTYSDKYAVYSVAIKKSSLDESLREPEEIYSSAFRLLSEYILDTEKLGQFQQLLVITDALSSNNKRKHLRAPLKSCLKSLTTDGKSTFVLRHHSSASDINLQIVDYYCWAIQRSLERHDDRSLFLIKSSLKGIWTIESSAPEDNSPKN